MTSLPNSNLQNFYPAVTMNLRNQWELLSTVETKQVLHPTVRSWRIRLDLLIRRSQQRRRIKFMNEAGSSERYIDFEGRWTKSCIPFKNRCGFKL